MHDQQVMQEREALTATFARAVASEQLPSGAAQGGATQMLHEVPASSSVQVSMGGFYGSLGEAGLRRLAEADDAKAGCLLGRTLMARGEAAEAVKWMRWAAEEKAYAKAMGWLGSWYMDGEGMPKNEPEGYKWFRRAYETAIEQGINVAHNKAKLAAFDAIICRLSNTPDASSANRAAVKKVKAALEEDPEDESLAGMLEDLKLARVCDGCGASARDEGVRLRVCTRCRQAFFCSQACLERSYERHKPDCTRLRAQRKARERAEGGQEGERADDVDGVSTSV